MGRADPLGCIPHDSQSSFVLNRLAYPSSNGATGHVLHYEIRAIFVLTEVQHGNDTGMRDARDRLGL
jgi:hypothetical protein